MGTGTDPPGNSRAELGAEKPKFFPFVPRTRHTQQLGILFDSGNGIWQLECNQKGGNCVGSRYGCPRGWIRVRDHRREETSLCAAICLQAVRGRIAIRTRGNFSDPLPGTKIRPPAAFRAAKTEEIPVGNPDSPAQLDCLLNRLSKLPVGQRVAWRRQPRQPKWPADAASFGKAKFPNSSQK